MMANLSNEKFDIQKLCHEMTMSRTQLYRKFRSLTDKSPNDYFRSLRLHKAKDLLAGTRITVAEAAYKSGFKNVSHFSRVFTRGIWRKSEFISAGKACSLNRDTQSNFWDAQ